MLIAQRSKPNVPAKVGTWWTPLDRIANGGAELLVTLRLDRLLSNFLVEYRARVVRQPV